MKKHKKITSSVLQKGENAKPKRLNGVALASYHLNSKPQLL